MSEQVHTTEQLDLQELKEEITIIMTFTNIWMTSFLCWLYSI